MNGRGVAWALSLLMLLQSVCMIGNLWFTSAVWDEPGHLAAGLVHWSTFDFRPYCVNPPLCRMLATLPALAIEHAFVPDLKPDELGMLRGEFTLGGTLFERDPQASVLMLRCARLVAMLWPLAGSLLIYWFTTTLFTRGAGIAAAVMWAFCPMVLAHGVLLPPDIPAAVGLMLVAAMLAAWLKHPGVGSAILLGVILGLGILIKTTLLIAYPVVFTLGIVAVVGKRWFVLRGGSKHATELAEGQSPSGAIRQRVGEFSLAVAISLLVINVGYFWSGSFTRLKDYTFTSQMLSGVDSQQRGIPSNRFKDSLLGQVPVPLPFDFVAGIDIQYRDFEMGGMYPYLLGEWNRDGFPLFYVWYYILKMPVAWLLLFVAGVVLLLAQPQRVKEGWLLGSLATLACVTFVFVSSRTDLNYCQRYSLVSLPLLCVVGGAVWSFTTNRYQRGVVIALLVWGALAGVASVPNSLSYYNELAGGVRHGRFMLHGNATDWGQDAGKIGQWCQQYPDRRPLSVATVGYPAVVISYGVEADALRCDGAMMGASWDQPIYGKEINLEGWHIVSMAHLLYPDSPYAPLRYHAPQEWIGNTHAVFHLDAAQAQSLLDGSTRQLPPMKGYEDAL